MKKMKKSMLVIFMFLLMVPALIFAGAFQDEAAAGEKKMKVAFIYHTSIGDYGWFWGHDKARKATDAALPNITTRALENVTPGAQAERVLKELCEDGYDIIVGAGSDFESDVKKVAPKYPDVAFLVCAASLVTENVESYYPETTQIWYVLGQVAAKLSKTNTLGMVGGIVYPVDVQIVNAFMLGAQSIKPDIVQRTLYLNTYYDPAAERDAALSLIEAGADVIAQATNTPAHVQAAEEHGVYAMSQYEDMRQFGPNAYVSGDIFNWEKYYIPTFKAIAEGKWKPKMAQPDITTGVCDIAPFGPMVTDEMKLMVEKTKDLLLNGDDPHPYWKGPIYDSTGKLRIKEGDRMSAKDLLGMTWFVKGVITSMD